MQEQVSGSPWPRLEEVSEASPLLLVGAIGTGVLFDLAVRSGTAALGAAVTVWALVVVVLAGRQTRSPGAVWCFAGAAVLAACLVLRASPWLVLPDLAAIALLLAAGVLVGRSGSPFDLRCSTLGQRAIALLPRLVWVPGWMLRPAVTLAGRVTARRRSDALALVRGVAVAVPIVAVLGVLLGSADPVFASFFKVDRGGDPTDAMLHVVLVVAGALLVGAVAAGLSSAHPAARAGRVWLGGREALVVVSVIDVLFVLFAVAQVVAALGGGAGALRSAGVSYSEYARSGFFQLLWVAGLTWLVVVVVRDAIPAQPGPQRRALIVAIEVAIGLVLLIVSVAHARLQLYEEAYGFTLLRLYSHVFAGLLAGAFVLLGACVGGVGSSRRWLLGAVGALTLAVLIGLNAVGPDDLVVRLNVERAQGTGRLDVDYLASLSADATPPALAGAAGLGPEDRDALMRRICAAPGPAGGGWESYNVATRAALDARRADCGR